MPKYLKTPFLQSTSRRLLLKFRAPSHVRFRPEVKFSISTWVEINWCYTWVSIRGKTNIFFTSFAPQGQNIFTKICSIFYKNVLWKKTFRMQLQDYMKTMMLDSINKRSKMFNFEIFKIVLLATINSKIVTASLLLNLYSCY